MTLEELAHDFKIWRNTRRYIGEKIPDELWVRVKKLLPIHGDKVICKTLGINSFQLKRFCLINNKDQAHSDGFAVAHLPPASTVTCELTLQKADKVLTLKLPSSQLPYCLPLMVNSL